MSNAHDWPTPTTIKGVIFDIHSTLIDQGDAESWLASALRAAPHDLSDAERRELVRFLDRVWEGARVSDPESTRDLSFENHSRVFHELIADGPGVNPALSHVLYEVMLDTWHAYDDTVPTLRALREAGVRTCLLSNAGVPIADVLDREGVTPWVDGIVLSYEVGVVKPNPEIFRVALESLGLSAASVLMVGDNANDDGGGAALGMRTLILPRTHGRVHGLNAVTALVLGLNAMESVG
jgi:HAD superfamily hydrolase (TIGR01509 family)